MELIIHLDLDHDRYKGKFRQEIIELFQPCLNLFSSVSRSR